MDSIAKKVDELARTIRRNGYTEPVSIELSVLEVRALDSFIKLWSRK